MDISITTSLNSVVLNNQTYNFSVTATDEDKDGLMLEVDFSDYHGASFLRRTSYSISRNQSTSYFELTTNDSSTSLRITIVCKVDGRIVDTQTISAIYNRLYPTYTPPSYKTGLTYNGNSQVLINRGEVVGGIMHYRLGLNGNDTTSVSDIVGIHHEQVTVYYRIEPNDGYSPVDWTSLGASTVIQTARNSIYYVNVSNGASFYLSETVHLRALASFGSPVFTSNDRTIKIISNTMTALSYGQATITVTVNPEPIFGDYEGATYSFSVNISDWNKVTPKIGGARDVIGVYVFTNGAWKKVTPYIFKSK